MSSERLKPLQPDDPERVGQYRLLARLGAGGMGRVYLGRSQGGRTVAVKVIHPFFAEDRQFRMRFTREVAAARRIGGFHTAQVVDADTDADPPWLVTEYIAGPSLQEAVDDHGALPERSVAALGAGLAEGLTAIHRHNVVHRDLKPGNVLLAKDGPRIIDFGIARALDATSQTTRTTMIGTPGFMSPEQYRGREVGPASDVFCLAAVLVFAATGRRPFGEGPSEALGYRVVNEDPDLTGVPASLFPLIAAGLEKDPDDRPGVGEFLDRCSALAAGAGLSLPEPVSTMIHTRVLQTEALGAGEKAAGERDTDHRPPPRDTPRRTPQGPPPPQPPPAPPRPPQVPPRRPPARSSSSSWANTWVPAALGVLLIAGVIFLNTRDKDEPTTSNAGNGRVTPTRTSSSAGGGAIDRGTSPSSSPSPDPTRSAFEDISSGDCLDAYKDPYDSTDWSEDMPNAVDCDRTDAYVRVTRVGDSLSDCDSDPLEGESWWSYLRGGDSIYLCVERRLRVGECFLGKRGEQSGRISITGHGLMTSWECGKSTVPKGFNYILQVTALTNGSCPGGSRRWSDFRGGNLCARVA